MSIHGGLLVTDKLLGQYTLPDHFGAIVGYEVRSIDRNARSARVGMVAKREHLSPSGKVHGGVISALLDYSSGAAMCTVIGEHDYMSTVELKVNYFRPIELGDNLEAESKVVFQGKKLCVMHTFLYRNSQPDPVAMASSTFNIFRLPSVPT